MGAWDATSFGNDTANDWAYELEKGGDLSYIEATLQKVLDVGEDYMEAPEAEEAIAAAEVTAWLRGQPTPVDAYTEKIAEWVAAHPVQSPTSLKSLTDMALLVVDRIQRQPSELAELWEGDPDWPVAMSDLRYRLTA